MPANRAAGWKQDFDVLEREFPKRQIDPYARVSEQTWHAEMAGLRSLVLERYSDAEIAWKIERILALQHDGHITIQADGSHAEPLSLPLRFRWFPEGIYVTAASDPSLLGMRLLKLGDVASKDLPARLAPFASIENESGLHAAVYRISSNVAVLADAGLAVNGMPVSVTLQGSRGERRELQARPQRYGDIAWHGPDHVPVYRESRTPPNWMEARADGKVLYVRYAECHDKPLSQELARQMRQVLRMGGVSGIVVDLRGNEGGDSAMFGPILDVLRGGTVRTVALVDRGTFSSGFRNAVELKVAGATVVGEPPSQRPVYTGNVESFTLPWSRLRVRYTTKWSRMGAADAMAFMPDIVRQPSAEEYLRGDDPVLALAIEQIQLQGR
jgi:hypothetical protein